MVLSKDAQVALNRLRILSEKSRRKEPIPGALEEHVAWLKEQDRLEALKAAPKALRDLNAAELAIYRRVMVKGNDSLLVSNDYVSSVLDWEIHGRDIHTMADGKWLNDECINGYMKILQQRAKDRGQKIWFFNSHFYTQLQKSGYAKVARWTKNKVNIFDMDKVVFPVHLGTHWCLGIINLREGRCEYYDSLKGGNDECLRLMKEYLQKESQDKRKTDFDFSDWGPALVNPDGLPLQRNGYDCGVFACMFAGETCGMGGMVCTLTLVSIFF